MGIGSSSFVPEKLSAILTGATNIVITNLSIPLKDTETAHVLQSGVKQLRIKCRELADLKYSFTLGESSTKYWTVYRNTCDNLTSLDLAGKTLYIQANKNSVVVEIAEFY